MKKILPFLFTLLFFTTLSLSAQTRIAVLPFENMDGKIEANIWSYDLQDSLATVLMYEDPNAENYYIVPADSIEMVLAELNLDPSNPQYKSDLWKAVDMLNIEKVVLGNFNIRSEKYLINAYIYSTKMRMAYPKHQAKDIFKTEENMYEAIGEIKDAILPGLKK